MPVDKVVKYRFTKGELDPKLAGRSDVQSYFSSAEQLENWWVIPQGGITRRPGLGYLDTVRNEITEYPKGSITPSAPNGGTATNINDGNLATFLTTTTNISTTDDYIAWKLDLGSLQNVAFLDIQKVSITSNTTTEFQIEWSTDDATYFALSETYNTIKLDTIERFYRITVDKSARYFRLIRNGTTDLGTDKVLTAEIAVRLNTMTVSPTRLTRFQFSDSQTYLCLFTDENVAIYRNGVLQANVASAYISSHLSTINYAQNDDTAIYVHKDISPQQLQRQGEDYAWAFTTIDFTTNDFVPLYPFNSVVSNPAATLTPSALVGIVTLTASAAVFTSADIGKYVFGNGGKARIIGFTSTTVITASVEIPFVSGATIPINIWDLESGYSALWNPTQGFPRAVTFHFGRLLFGGFRGAPSVLAASTLDNIFDFQTGTNSDSDAFWFELATDKGDIIYHLNSHDNLEIFTNNSEYIVKSTDAFTPLGFKASRQTSDGSKLEIIPEENQEGGTIFVQKDGASILEFNFNEVVNTFRNERLDLWSSHLTVSPIDAALQPNTSNEQSSYWLQINSTGTLIAISILKSQEVVAATANITDGEFVNVTTVNNSSTTTSSMYVIVKRTVGGSEIKYLEELLYDRTTDSSLYMAFNDARISGTTVTGLGHLEGKSVWTIIDGGVFGPKVVTGGAITLDEAVGIDLEIGLDYVPIAVTNPVEDPEKAGPLIGNTKSIFEINVQVFETQNLRLNSYSPFRQTLSTSAISTTIDKSPKIHTGRFRMTGFVGWDEFGKVTITQTHPLKATLLNLAVSFIFS